MLFCTEGIQLQATAYGKRIGRLIMNRRLGQLALIVSTFGFCWLGMQVVHELGHVVAGWAGGETVDRVVLHPLAISRIDVSHDRHPLLVVWGGPVVGSLLPLGLLAVAWSLRLNPVYLFRFFAGFCLIANGAYLGVGSFVGVGDAGDLVRHGAPRWSLIVFGLVCAPAGLYLWNGLGTRFGLGEARGEVDPKAVAWAVGLATVIVLVEVLAGSR